MRQLLQSATTHYKSQTAIQESTYQSQKFIAGYRNDDSFGDSTFAMQITELTEKERRNLAKVLKLMSNQVVVLIDLRRAEGKYPISVSRC